ncbi:alpha/beta hydrolase [Bacillus sp. ISL-41]|uniref:alpha/beta fold hydrolase n=1 Tax=Bacillus sp. ISL-41 TaxID=2819127 RepID=UPI001BE770A0|nr:alpha/beta hydrolase [Bacillus sp. ISL-41]MBT2642893.1 alpha/beta hydrolase [Bacillus sp. ISL-41]
MLTESKIQLPNSIELNVKYSTSNKPVILFLHFSGGTLNMWDGILPRFSEDYRIIAPDLRGHGKSDKPLTGYHIVDFAHDVYLLLQALDVQSCHIVGSSMGAEIGLSLAASHPDMVKSIVCEGALYNEFGEYGLFDGTAEEITAEKERQRKKLSERRMPEHPSLNDFLTEAKEPIERMGILNEHFLSYLKSTAEEQDDGTITSHYRNHVRIEYIEKYWDLQFQDYYKEIKCPVLFMPSEEECADEKIRRSLDAFSKLVNSSEIIKIEGSRHAYVWMQLPDQAGLAVKDFLNRVAEHEDEL